MGGYDADAEFRHFQLERLLAEQDSSGQADPWNPTLNDPALQSELDELRALWEARRPRQPKRKLDIERARVERLRKANAFDEDAYRAAVRAALRFCDLIEIERSGTLNAEQSDELTAIRLRRLVEDGEVSARLEALRPKSSED